MKSHCFYAKKNAIHSITQYEGINPLSPNIHIQILQTDLYTFPSRRSWENLKKIILKHFLLGDHFINSHNLISWQCTDIIRRKLMLVTSGT